MPLTKVVCCCAVSWRLERPVRQRVPTKMFTPEWTPTSRSFEQKKKRQNCSVSHRKNRSHIPKVTGGRLLSSSRSLKTSSHSDVQTSGTRLQPGPVSAHWDNPGFVFTVDYNCLCLEIMLGRWHVVGMHGPLNEAVQNVERCHFCRSFVILLSFCLENAPILVLILDWCRSQWIGIGTGPTADRRPGDRSLSAEHAVITFFPPQHTSAGTTGVSHSHRTHGHLLHSA